MAKATYIFISIFLLVSCREELDCNNDLRVIPVKMKYISFDLEIEKDTFPVSHAVFYRDSSSATVIFKNSESTPDYAAVFVISIQSPVSTTWMTQEIRNIDYDKNKLEIQKVGSYTKSKSKIRSTTYYKPAICISMKTIVGTDRLKTMNENCYPSAKIKNIVFDDRYESWLDSEWFSLEGIDENTVLE